LERVWVGNVKEKKAAGTNILSNGRKRMFKGHKWERTLAAREAEEDSDQGYACSVGEVQTGALTLSCFLFDSSDVCTIVS
jgi:hypothetical protein